MYIFQKMLKNLQRGGKAVELCVSYLFKVCGSHEKAAEYLGYSIRQYRDIRRKIETGYILPARIENLILAKAHELQAAGASK
jgi:hypothetical protein